MGLLTYPASSSAALKRQQFTSSGTFVLPSQFGPANPLYCTVTAVGGGGAGGGGNHMPGGGGGGRVVRQTMGLTGNIPIIIGAGGAYTGGNGGNGGDTFFGTPKAINTNLIENPFFTDGRNRSTTNWSGTTLTGSVTNSINDWTSSPKQRTILISDPQHPTGFFKSPYGWYMSNTSTTVSQYRWTTNNFMTVTPNTAYNMGIYTESDNGSITMYMYLDWYTSGDVLISTSELSYTTTSRAKYSGTYTSPANAVKAKIRLMPYFLAATIMTVGIWGMYLSEQINYCPWEDEGNLAYWPSTRFTGRISEYDATTGFATGYGPIIAGGGGGGQQSGDPGDNAIESYRWGGIGGGQGGMSRSTSDTTANCFYLGGDGAGAGSLPFRESIRRQNSTTPYATSYPGTINDVNKFSRLNLSRAFGRPLSNLKSSEPIFMNSAADTSNYHQIDIEGGMPLYGYSAGGPGAGYHLPTAASTFVKRFNYRRELPYGNGGAADYENSSQTTSNYGYINQFRYGNWKRDGDPGIVTIEWTE